MNPILALRQLRHYVEPVIADEITRLYLVDDEAKALRMAVEEQRRIINRLQAVAGERTAEIASLRGRLAELAPEQVAIARRDATFLGHGYLRLTARGRHRFDVERVAPGRVSVRDADD